MDNLPDILQAVLTDAVLALIGAVLAYGVASLHKAVAYFKASLDEKQFEFVKSIVRSAVLYAEQSGVRDKLEKAGAEKKKRAIEFAVQLLNKYGIKITTAELDKLIEEAVKNEFNWA